jgi:hypothetical protein
MDNPLDKQPANAVAGLSEVLLALGEELRAANRKIGSQSIGVPGEEGAQGPTLTVFEASVELAVSVTASASGGFKVWVVNAEAGGSYERSGKVAVHLHTEPLGVGM